MLIAFEDRKNAESALKYSLRQIVLLYSDILLPVVGQNYLVNI